MTNKEAIEDLKFMVENDDFGTLHVEAIEMAISALQIEAQLEKNCKNCGNHDVPVVCSESCVDRCNWIPKKTEPCEDAISRQAAIKAIWDGINMDIYTSEVKEILEGLPSVQPKVKTGKWIMKEDSTSFVRQIPRRWAECSCCGWSCDIGTAKRYDYCPDCGSRNEREGE